MANRRIIVDDTDQNIQYEGNWFVDAGNITNQDHDSGPTFFRTQHGTTTSGSSFSFRFKGEVYISLTVTPTYPYLFIVSFLLFQEGPFMSGGLRIWTHKLASAIPDGNVLSMV